MSHIVENVTVGKASSGLSEAEQDDTVSAFNALDYRPALTAGAATGQAGSPALGWVTALRRVGNRLVATVETAHASIAAALRSGAKLAASVYHDLHRGGRRYPRALRAVSLPGIPAPVLPALVPSGVMEFSSGDYRCLRVYELDSRDDAGAEVDARVREYRAKHPEVKTYEEAMTAVLAENPDLHHVYAMGDSQTPEDMDAQRWRNAMGLPDLREERQSAGIAIQKKVAAEIARDSTLTQMAALKIVLQNNPDLADAYRNGHGWFGGTSFDAIMGS